MGFNLTPAGVEGIYGPVTATLDWCEENHIWTIYITELWNTLSNLWYMLFAVVGWYLCHQLKAELRSFTIFWGLFLIGIGSFSFHASLLFETQMADELPMIYCTCIQIYSILLTFPSEKNKKQLILSGLIGYSIVVTAVYLHLRNPVFHEVAYALLVLIAIFVPLSQVYHFRKTNPERFPMMIGLFISSVAAYATGFALWNIENQTCDAIRSFREQIGYPYRVWFELHAWWHFFTAVGCYGGALLTCHMRFLAIGRDDVQLKWSGIFYLSSPISQEKMDLANSKALEYKKQKKD
ncbi:Alkaline ceramidase 3 [Phlyctochytrium planicorne]|nr:Alkaline ceramidase 3 [Phlyctochytrium planicorne]